MTVIMYRTYTRRCHKCKVLYSTHHKFSKTCTKCDARLPNTKVKSNVRRSLAKIVLRYGFTSEEHQILLMEMQKWQDWFNRRKKKFSAKEFFEVFLK